MKTILIQDDFGEAGLITIENLKDVKVEQHENGTSLIIVYSTENLHDEFSIVIYEFKDSQGNTSAYARAMQVICAIHNAINCGKYKKISSNDFGKYYMSMPS